MTQEQKDRAKIIFKTVVGSRLYGMDTPESDTDIKGLFVPHLNDIVPSDSNNFGIEKFNPLEMFEEKNNLLGKDKIEAVLYSVKKYISLSMTGNPTLTELAFAPKEKCLVTTKYSDLVMEFTRKNLITKSTLDSYCGYFLSESTKRKTSKMSAHAYRIGMQGLELATTGATNPCLSGEVLETTKNIRYERIEESEVVKILADVDAKLIQVRKTTSLKEKPNVKMVSDFLVNFFTNYYEREPA